MAGISCGCGQGRTHGRKARAGRQCLMNPGSISLIQHERFSEGYLRWSVISSSRRSPWENWYNGTRKTPGCTTFPENPETGRNKTRKTRNRTGTVPCSPAGIAEVRLRRVTMAADRGSPYFCAGNEQFGPPTFAPIVVRPLFSDAIPAPYYSAPGVPHTMFMSMMGSGKKNRTVPRWGRATFHRNKKYQETENNSPQSPLPSGLPPPAGSPFGREVPCPAG